MNGRIRTFVATIAAAILLGILASAPLSSAEGAGLIYVDADDGLTTGTPNLSPLSAINPFADTRDDNLWGFRSGFGAYNTVYESGIAEDSPMLTMTASGLTAGSSYDMYGVYWTNPNQNWMLQMGVEPDNLTIYNHRGPDGNAAFVDSVAGQRASAAAWSSPPLDAPGGSPRFSQPNLVMLLGFAGTAVANPSGEVEVFFDDLQIGTTRRTWLDGLAYVEAGTPVFVEASINRDTGELLVNNPTASDFQITSYQINSAAGSLDATQWSTISGVLDGSGDGSFDSDVWNITAPSNPAATPYATQLAEASTGTAGGTLTSDGGSLNFGNVWQKTRFEDVVVNLTLADGAAVIVAPSYTGSAVIPGDFNGDGLIDVNDYLSLMANMYTDLSELTLAEAYTRGDMTGSRAIDFNDFIAFRRAFDEENGAGAFAQMLAAVPEPTSGGAALLALGVLACWRRGRRRLVRVGRPMLSAAVLLAAAGFTVSSAEAAPVTNWEIDPLQDPQSTVLSDAHTDSPILGDGTPNNANAVAMFAPIALTSIADGEQIVLSGSAEFIGDFAGNFRWGLFQDNGIPPDTAGWLGFLAGNANATGTGPVWSRDPEGTNFENVTFASTTSGRATVLGRGTELQQRPFTAGVYDFNLTVARFGDTAEVRASVIGTSREYFFATNSFPENHPDRTVFSFDRVGYLSTDSLQADQIQFMGVDVSVSPIDAPTLRVESTGQVEIVNTSSESLDLIFYEIASLEGALNVGGWDGLGAGWVKAGGSNSNVLGEGNLESATTLALGGSLGLGTAFAPGGAQDLIFRYAASDGVLLRGFVEFVDVDVLPGDFNNDSVVDAADYTVWRDGLGTEFTAEEYDVWKANFGTSLSSAGAVAAVPEPATLGLAIGAALLMLGLHGRRQY